MYNRGGEGGLRLGCTVWFLVLCALEVNVYKTLIRKSLFLISVKSWISGCNVIALSICLSVQGTIYYTSVSE